MLMKELSKMAVFAVVILALSPFAGFWIVALVGAALLLLPLGAMISMVFPKVSRQFEDRVLARVGSTPSILGSH